jgi:hypothetical protein
MITEFDYVYNSFYQTLGRIIRYDVDMNEVGWYLIEWPAPDSCLQWLCDASDFIREDVMFLEEIEEKKRLEILLRLR